LSAGKTPDEPNEQPTVTTYDPIDDVSHRESPEEAEALGAYRTERDAAFLGRPWDEAGADAWVSAYDPGLT
jgi:hypothetical protein